MARPHKQSLDYFPHNVNASFDNKIELLEHRFQNDGYAIFFKILEKVFISNGKFNLTSDIDFEIYGNKWHVGKDKLVLIVNFMREISLFPRTNFVSSAVKKRLNKIEAERERKRNYVKTKEVKGNIMDVHNNGTTAELPPKENLKKRKEKKTIKESIYINIPPSLELVKNRIMERSLKIDAEKFIAYYESNGWKVGKNPMKNWDSCLTTWSKSNYPTNNGKSTNGTSGAEQTLRVTKI